MQFTMAKFVTYTCAFFMSLLVVSCQPSPNQSSTTNVAPPANNNSSTPQAIDPATATTTLPSGKTIPKAENGITVVRPNGWTSDELAFHQSYCEQYAATLNDRIDVPKFCTCFIEKIQYYYEPIYFMEAYQDQKKWNTECFQNAEK